MSSTPSRQYDAIFFDAGYTLLKPRPYPSERYMRLVRAYGGDVPDRDTMIATLRRLFAEFPQPGPDAPPDAYRTSDAQDRAWWQEYDCRVFAAHGVPAECRPAAATEMYTYFSTPADWELYDETLPLLDDLRARDLILGVCSNWSSGLHAVLDGLGLQAYFAFVYTSAEVGELKPGPRLFERGLDATGVAPERVLHVGDSYEADIVGCARAGIRGVLVNRWNRAPAAAAPVIEDLTGLPALLD